MRAAHRCKSEAFGSLDHYHRESDIFAAVAVGASQLPLQMQVDSSLGGILRGMLVLLVLLFGGWQARRAGARLAVDDAPPVVPATPGGEV